MKITIHEVTFTVSFDSDHYQMSAEMAAMMVRECEWAAHRVNNYYQPSKPICEPPDPIHDLHEDDGLNDVTVHHDDPF
jgi:hypothetical protein